MPSIKRNCWFRGVVDGLMLWEMGSKLYFSFMIFLAKVGRMFLNIQGRVWDEMIRKWMSNRANFFYSNSLCVWWFLIAFVNLELTNGLLFPRRVASNSKWFLSRNLFKFKLKLKIQWEIQSQSLSFELEFGP